MDYFGEIPLYDNKFLDLTGMDWIEATFELSLGLLLFGVAMFVVGGIADAVADSFKKSLPDWFPTFFAGLPVLLGLIGVLVGLALDGSGHDVRLYVVNGSDEPRTLVFNDEEVTLPAKGWTLLRDRGPAEDCRLEAELATGDKVDEACHLGLSILNFSDEQPVAWRQVDYRDEHYAEVEASGKIENTEKSHGAGHWSVTELAAKAIEVYHFSARPPDSRQVSEDDNSDPVLELFFIEPDSDD